MRGICDYCKGTEHIKCPFNYEFCQCKKMTNEEWLHSLNTEELVDYLYSVHKGGASVERQFWIEEHKERIKMQIRGWLKEIHK